MKKVTPAGWRRIAGFAPAALAALGGVASAAEPDVLRVAVKPIAPFVYAEADGLSGFSIDLWNKIAGQLGVRTEFVQYKSVEELIAATEKGTVDAGIAAVTINAAREAVVDFSHPYFRSGLRIGVPAHSGPSWYATLSRFCSVDLLGMFLTLTTLALAAAHLLWFIERRVNPECFPTGYLTGVGEALWWSVATIITGGCENKAPVSLLGRLVAVAWMLGSIVLVASFTATLASQMTSETVTGAIAGPEGLPGRVVATVTGTTAVTALRGRDARVLECADLRSALWEVTNGRAEAVVFDADVLAHEIKEHPEGGVRLIGPVFEHHDYGIVLPRGSDLRKAVNQALLVLGESEKLAELNIEWFGEKE